MVAVWWHAALCNRGHKTNEDGSTYRQHVDSVVGTKPGLATIKLRGYKLLHLICISHAWCGFPALSPALFPALSPALFPALSARPRQIGR